MWKYKNGNKVAIICASESLSPETGKTTKGNIILTPLASSIFNQLRCSQNLMPKHTKLTLADIVNIINESCQAVFAVFCRILRDYRSMENIEGRNKIIIRTVISVLL